MRPSALKYRPLACAVTALGVVGMPALAQADDDAGFEFSAELEIGVEAVVGADDPETEVSDLFFSAEIEAELALGERVTGFAELTLESVTDAERDRAFRDMGLYVGELGLSFDLDPVTLNLGKISAAFGSAWDSAPGYFGADFAEDYELEEVIGASAEIELGDGALTLSVFYADDTRLSDSWGTRRGRNSVEEGGVGNTGKLNNFALQYDRELGDTTLHFGARHLSRTEEEDTDENGIVLGMTHSFSDDFEVIAEVAHFNGWEGGTEDATLATLGAQLTRGAFSYSAAVSQRDISGAPSDHLVTLGLDYEFDNGMTLSTGYAHVSEEEEKSNVLAVSLVIPLN